MKYVVMIDVDGEWMYVPHNTKMFPNHPEPRIFDTLEEALEERDKWNTGTVVEYGRSSDEIRHMTDEERRRALVRSQKNNEPR